MAQNDMPADVLRELLEYDAETGVIRWSMATVNGHRAGQLAGTVALNGYRMIRLQGKLRLAHRLAWTMHYGHPPALNIDHVNRDRADNRLVNLRDVSQKANSRNHPSKPLLVGAVLLPSGRWAAQVHKYGGAHAVGEFDTPAQANKEWQKQQAKVADPDAPRPMLRPVFGLKR